MSQVFYKGRGGRFISRQQHMRNVRRKLAREAKSRNESVARLKAIADRTKRVIRRRVIYKLFVVALLTILYLVIR